MKIIIDKRIVFFKINEKDKERNSFKAGPAVFVEKSWADEGYSVYRTRITKFGKKPYELGDGWNLYKGLELNKAIKAAKNALKYL